MSTPVKPVYNPMRGDFDMVKADPAQTVTVAPSGAQFTTIQAAINSISDAAVNKAYVVLISAGTYVENITMKAYVALVGVGNGPAAPVIVGTITATMTGTEWSMLNRINHAFTITADSQSALRSSGSLLVNDYFLAANTTGDYTYDVVDLTHTSASTPMVIFSSYITLSDTYNGSTKARNLIKAAGTATAQPFNLGQSTLVMNVAALSGDLKIIESSADAPLNIDSNGLTVINSKAAFAGTVEGFCVENASSYARAFTSNTITLQGTSGGTAYGTCLDSGGNSATFTTHGNTLKITGFTNQYSSFVDTTDVQKDWLTSMEGNYTKAGSGLCVITPYDAERSGFVQWSGSGDYWGYDTGTKKFMVKRVGVGMVRDTPVTWVANQDVTLLGHANGAVNWVYMTALGVIGTTNTPTATLFRDNIVLFEVWVHSTNYLVVKENHPYSFPTNVSLAWHNLFGCLLQDATQTLAAAAPSSLRHVNVVGTNTLTDHGLDTTVSAQTPATWLQFVVETGGTPGMRLIDNAQAIIAKYSSGAAGGAVVPNNQYCVYRVGVTKDTITSSAAQFVCVADTTYSGNLPAANGRITAGTVASFPTELKSLEVCQLGYVIIKSTSDTTGAGTIEQVTTALQVFGAAFVSGGTSTSGSLISLSVTNFNGELSGTETNVQTAMDRIDDYDSLLDYGITKDYRVGNTVRVTQEGFIGNWRCTTAHSTVSATFSADLEITSSTANWEITSNSEGSRELVNQASHGFAAGDVLYHTGTVYAKAKADVLATSKVVGIVSGATTNFFVLAKSGKVTKTGWALGTGTNYLSATTAGALTTTKPEGYYIVQVGIAPSATMLQVQICSDNYWDNTDPTEIAVIPPTLDLDFSGTALPSTITFTRSTIGTYFDYDGYLKTAAVNIPRIDYDPATKALKGLLIEEQRAQLFVATERINDSTVWTTSQCSIAINSAVAPDGSYSADQIVESTTASTNHYIQQTYTGWASGTTYTLSAFVKGAGRSEARMVLPSAVFGSSLSAYYNLSTVAVGAVSGGVTATITAIGNDWYRITMAAAATATASGAVTIYPASSGNSSYTGDGKSGIYVWGAQLEAGAFATSYIPAVDTFIVRSPISNITYTSKSFSVATQTTGPRYCIFKPDGAKMYVSDTADKIYQYSITGWDVSTAVYDSVLFSEAVTGTFYGLSFNNDGTKAYRVLDNDASSVVREYTLTTPYDVTTTTSMTYASVNYALPFCVDANASPRGLCFSADGVYMYVNDNYTDKIYRHTLATPWSLASVSATGELSVSSIEGAVNGLWLDSTGKIMVLTGSTGDKIYILHLATAYDITTGVLVDSKSIASEDGTAYSTFVKSDGTALFMLGAVTNTVYQYSSLFNAPQYYYNSSGTLTANTNPYAQRTTYNPDPARLHLAPKLLLEPESTNLILQSEDFATTWTASGTTVTANDTAAPDGNTTADKLANSGAAAGEVYQDITTVAATVYTFSCFVKAGDVSAVSLQNMQVSGTVDKAKVSFDLLAETMTETTTTNLIDKGIRRLPNGWYRIWITSSATDTSTRFKVINDSTTSAKYIYGWGAQVEAAYCLSSYIPTTTASVRRSPDVYTSAVYTRNADNASMTGTNFTGWYRWDEGTIYCEADKPISLAGVYGYRYSISDNSSSNAIYSANYNANDRLLTVDAGGSGQANISSATNPTVLTRYAGAFKINDFAAYDSASVSGTDSSGSIPAKVDRMRIGANADGTNYFLNGHIRRIIFWPARLDNTKLQQMTV